MLNIIYYFLNVCFTFKIINSLLIRVVDLTLSNCILFSYHAEKLAQAIGMGPEALDSNINSIGIIQPRKIFNSIIRI
jgi:hypothetical protein